MVFTYIWEYSVVEGFQEVFKKTYGPEGEWVQLFKKADGFIKTTLNLDTSNKNRFLTVDLWKSKEDHDRFLEQFSKEYRTLDEICEKYTSQENLLGSFDSY